jgi:hypothetical protein
MAVLTAAIASAAPPRPIRHPDHPDRHGHRQSRAASTARGDVPTDRFSHVTLLGGAIASAALQLALTARCTPDRPLIGTRAPYLAVAGLILGRWPRRHREMRETPGPPSKVGPGRQPTLAGGGDGAKPCARASESPGRRLSTCIDRADTVLGRALRQSAGREAGLRPSPMEARARGISGVAVRAARRTPLTIPARVWRSADPPKVACRGWSPIRVGRFPGSLLLACRRHRRRWWLERPRRLSGRRGT